MKPNGLAFDSARGTLVAANVGDPSIPDSHSVSVVDLARRERIAEVKVPGRTRWAIHDPAREMFFVNIASPARIIAIDARDPTRISKEYEVPAAGPHGLDLDPATGRLLCACDAGVLFAIDAASGRVLGDVPLSGCPDVIFLHSQYRRLYVVPGRAPFSVLPKTLEVCPLKSKLRVIATTLGALVLMNITIAATISFDQDAPGVAPAGWRAGLIGRGSPKWLVEADATAPSKPNVLKQSGSGAFRGASGRMHLSRMAMSKSSSSRSPGARTRPEDWCGAGRTATTTNHLEAPHE